MDWKQLATLKNSYDRRKELLEFQKQLKENPLQEHEYISLIDDSNLDVKGKMEFRNHIKGLRKAEMIIDDIPEPYEDFIVRVEKEGRVPIKASVMKQMNNEEFSKFNTKRMALYDDLNGGQKVIHYKFKDRSGYIRETGTGISVLMQTTDDIETIKNAQRYYKTAKEEISKTLEEIEVNGDKYQNFMAEREQSPMEKMKQGKQI
jgi:hypothetical protein